MRRYWLILSLIFLSSCSSKSPESYLAQGRAINQELLRELSDIHDIDALLVKLPELERRFNQLVDLMIEARKYQIKKKCSWLPGPNERLLCLELSHELQRIYQIPAAKPLVEKSQEGALMKLDAFESKLQKIAKSGANKNFNSLE